MIQVKWNVAKKKKECKNNIIILDQNIIPIEDEHQSWKKI
jgi:hypothetical protein